MLQIKQLAWRRYVLPKLARNSAVLYIVQVYVYGSHPTKCNEATACFTAFIVLAPELNCNRLQQPIY